jgi:hypothetical protein
MSVNCFCQGNVPPPTRGPVEDLAQNEEQRPSSYAASPGSIRAGSVPQPPACEKRAAWRNPNPPAFPLNPRTSCGRHGAEPGDAAIPVATKPFRDALRREAKPAKNGNLGLFVMPRGHLLGRAAEDTADLPRSP